MKPYDNVTANSFDFAIAARRAYRKGEIVSCEKILSEHLNYLIVELVGSAPSGPRVCRVCGCTDNHACPSGCEWIDQDLCSTCAVKIVTKLTKG